MGNHLLTAFDVDLLLSNNVPSRQQEREGEVLLEVLPLLVRLKIEREQSDAFL